MFNTQYTLLPIASLMLANTSTYMFQVTDCITGNMKLKGILTFEYQIK